MKEVVLPQWHCPIFLEAGKPAGTSIWKEGRMWGAGSISTETVPGTERIKRHTSYRKGRAVFLKDMGREASLNTGKWNWKFNSILIIITTGPCKTIHACLHDQRLASTSRVTPHVIFVMLLESGSLIRCGAHQFSQQARETCLPLPSRCWDDKHATIQDFLIRILRPKLKSSCLQDKLFTLQPSP